jgi:hypothetical protein
MADDSFVGRQEHGDFAFTVEAGECARFGVGTLEGAMLLAHARGNAGHFVASAAILLKSLGIKDL